MRIYSQVRLGVSPEINAVCTLLLGAAALAVVAHQLLAKKAEQTA
jgi:putrescine transport system permease protein